MGDVFKNLFNLRLDAEGYCIGPKGQRVCGARKNSGKPGPCLKPPMRNGRCDKHGGATPSGFASPHLVHGRYSKMLPTRLLAHYQELKADPELTSLASEIALVRAHIFELIQSFDTGEAEGAWDDLRSAWARLVAARESGNTGGMATALNAIGQMVERGSAQAVLWREIGFEIDRVNRLVGQQSKQEQLAEAMITIERALIWAGAVGAILREYIHDPAVLTSISNRIRGTLVVAPGR